MLADFPIYITFAGLIAFVPMKNDPTAYKLLMPQATGDQDAPDGCPLPRHMAMLLVSHAFECKYDNDSCPDAKALKQLMDDLHAKSDDPNLYAFRLDGKDVKISFPPTAETMYHRPK